jgi:hypothetical protein
MEDWDRHVRATDESRALDSSLTELRKTLRKQIALNDVKRDAAEIVRQAEDRATLAKDWQPHVPVEHAQDGICSICWWDLDDYPRGLHLKRVEFGKAGTHVEGNKVTYVVAKHSLTYSETWRIVQTDHEPDSDKTYLERQGFKDREGNWWLLWHNLYETVDRASEQVAKDVQEGLEDEYYRDTNFFHGEL